MSKRHGVELRERTLTSGSVVDRRKLRQSQLRPIRLNRRQAAAVARARLTIWAALLDLVAVTGSATLIGVIYHQVFYKIDGMAGVSTEFGLAMALLFVVLNALRADYALFEYLKDGFHPARVFFAWNLTFIVALVFMFAAKETAVVSRGAAVLFYAVGYAAVLAGRSALVSRIARSAAAGRIALRRVVVVGEEEELDRFADRHRPWTVGVDVIASTVLRGTATLVDDLALAAATARVLQPDDVYILAPSAQDETIEAALAAFMNVPAAIHLGPQRVLDRFSKAHVSRIGSMASLHLVRQPLTVPEQVVKRVVDSVLATALLVVLVPVFLGLALAIRLDTPGPVLFAQRRYGFNQEPFRILKFRSMTVAEDGADLRQAVRGDTRITRVGRFMRRLNLDELPQLLNVLRGEMSLVGPRPHALAHNQLYARTIADYARRHNVKPGITGWAQVHGLRGETASDDVMRARVEHDLFYIDNWSFGLDVRILCLTLVSPRAYRNAY